MNTSDMSTKVAYVIKELKVGDCGPLGWSYTVWRLLQHGQEKLFRWPRFIERFERQIRWQSGHDHCCSLNTLINEKLILIRPHLKLDELLVVRCAQLHDQPEGIRMIDTPAPLKTDQNDLDEYRVFEDMYIRFEFEVWQEMQRCYLLQTCLKNPPCFPQDARLVMSELAEEKRNEALFFSAMEKIDYLYYAYECGIERKLPDITAEVAYHQFESIERFAEQIPGFKLAVWTDNVRSFFHNRFMAGQKLKRLVIPV